MSDKFIKDLNKEFTDLASISNRLIASLFIGIVPFYAGLSEGHWWIGLMFSLVAIYTLTKKDEVAFNELIQKTKQDYENSCRDLKVVTAVDSEFDEEEKAEMIPLITYKKDALKIMLDIHDG